MGKMRELCENKEKIDDFRRIYRIPDDVGLRLADSNTLREDDQTWEQIHIPILFIAECGLRLPLHPFFREVCSRCNLNPLQLCPNFVRVVMGVIALNKLLGLNLNWWDIRRMYSVVSTRGGTYYLKARDDDDNDKKLITDLPNSAKGEGGDFLIVTGNWEPRDSEGKTIGFHCPHRFGKPPKLSSKINEEDQSRDVKLALAFDGFEPTPVGLGRAAHILIGYTPSYRGGIRRSGEGRPHRPWPPVEPEPQLPRGRTDRSRAGKNRGPCRNSTQNPRVTVPSTVEVVTEIPILTEQPVASTSDQVEDGSDLSPTYSPSPSPNTSPNISTGMRIPIPIRLNSLLDFDDPYPSFTPSAPPGLSAPLTSPNMSTLTPIPIRLNSLFDFNGTHSITSTAAPGFSPPITSANTFNTTDVAQGQVSAGKRPLENPNTAAPGIEHPLTKQKIGESESSQSTTPSTLHTSPARWAPQLTRADGTQLTVEDKIASQETAYALAQVALLPADMGKKKELSYDCLLMTLYQSNFEVLQNATAAIDRAKESEKKLNEENTNQAKTIEELSKDADYYKKMWKKSIEDYDKLKTEKAAVERRATEAEKKFEQDTEILNAELATAREEAQDAYKRGFDFATADFVSQIPDFTDRLWVKCWYTCCEKAGIDKSSPLWVENELPSRKRAAAGAARKRVKPAPFDNDQNIVGHMKAEVGAEQVVGESADTTH